MSRKTAIWVWMFIASTVGAYIPSLLGSGMFSLSGILFSAIGGFVGIWIGFKTGY